MHPASQSRPIDIRAPAGNWGNICALRAFGGRSGRWRSHVWVDLMNEPSGISTEIGVVAILLFRCGVSMEM